LLARSRDTSSLTVLFTSAASIAGVFLATLGIGFGRALHEPRLDSLASVAIALVLASSAFLIAARSKAMLIGASATPEGVARLSNIAGRHAAVTCINGAMTVHLSVDQLMVALKRAFDRGLNTEQIEEAASEICKQLQAEFPAAAYVSINPQGTAQYRGVLARRGW